MLLYLHVATRTACSRAPRLHASSDMEDTLVASLQNSMPPMPSYRHTCSAPPDLHTTPPPHRYPYSSLPDLQTSISLRLHRVSKAPGPQASRAPCLHASISLRLQRAPDL